MTSRLLGTTVALSLFPAAIFYAAIVPMLFLLFALGATSFATIVIMGVAGAAALLCLVLAIQLLIRPRRPLVMTGAAMSLIAFLLYFFLRQHVV